MGFSRNNLAIANFFDWFAAVTELLTLISVIWGVYTYLWQRAREAASEDLGSICCDPQAMGYFVAVRPSYWKFWRWNRVQIPRVPTISGFICAGDSLSFTSSVFDLIPPNQATICWLPIYTGIFDEIFRDERKRREVIEHSPDVRISLSRAAKQKEIISLQFGPERHSLYEKSRPPLLTICARKLDVYDAAGIPPQEEVYACFARDKISDLWIVDDKPCIPTSREELACLSLLLGVQLRSGDGQGHLLLHGAGAFGISLNAEFERTLCRLHLLHGPRGWSEEASKGSGYSTLYAKHIPCGSLPFGQAPGWIKTIHVTTTVLRALHRGYNIMDTDTPPALDPCARYLMCLPKATGYDFFCGIEELEHGYGLIKDIDHNSIVLPDNTPASWSRAVAGIAFGGLVPQSSKPLMEAIQFTALGGCSIEGCLSELDRLTDVVHKAHPEQFLFGNYVKDRIRHPVRNESYRSSAPTNRTAAAVFSWYMTLVEYVTANFNLEPAGIYPLDELLKSVFQDCCVKLQRSHEMGVDLIYARETLGDLLRVIVDKLEICMANLTLDDCGQIARCIIVAWAEQVSLIYLRVRKEDRPQQEDANVFLAPALEELPSISALGRY